MNMRRVLFWFVVIGLLAWAISDPSNAGHTAAGVVHTVLGWGKSAAVALITFVKGLF